MWALALMAMFGTTVALAQGQGNRPPDCVGQFKALQYQGGWLCVNIPAGPPGPAGAPGPAGPPGQIPAQPPASQCITSNWDGTQWQCVTTNYLEAQ